MTQLALSYQTYSKHILSLEEHDLFNENRSFNLNSYKYYLTPLLF